MMNIRYSALIFALLITNSPLGLSEPCNNAVIEPSGDASFQNEEVSSNHVASKTLPDDIIHQSGNADNKNSTILIRVARALGEFAVGLLREERAFGRGQFSQVINPSRVVNRRPQQTLPLGKRI